MKLERLFDNVRGVLLQRRLRETGTCYAPNRRAVMRTDLYQGASGAWEVEARELDGPGRIVNRYEHEADARRALELAYEYGKQHGEWQIHRSADYEPAV